MKLRPSLRRLRHLRPRRWTLLAAVGFVLITGVLGPAGTAGARPPEPLRPIVPLDDPDIFHQIGGRFCGTGVETEVAAGPIAGPLLSVFKRTSFCDGLKQDGNMVYCNETSLLSMVDPNIGLGGDLHNDQGEIDKSSAALNVMTGPALKLAIDQLNGKWYELDPSKFTSASTSWYPPEARDEAIDRGNCSLLENPPSMQCNEIKALPNARDRARLSRSGVLPDDCVGTYPSANYNISYDGGNVLSVDRKIWGGLTGFVFNVGKGGIQIATWSIDQAYRMELNDYTTLSESISTAYKDRIIGPWGLYDFSWLILIGWMGITALRGRMGLAGGEFVAAIAFVAVAGFLLANQSMYMREVSKVTNLASGALFQIATNPSAKTPITDTPNALDVGDTALEPLRRDLHIQFVERPYEYINWGQPVDTLPEPCKERANRITSVGATEDHGWSWQYLQAAGSECNDVVRYNRNPSANRFFGALITTIVGLMVAVTIVLMAVTVMIAKFTLAILFGVLPFAAIAAPLPGPGRRILLAWFSAAWQSAAVIIGTANLLALLMLAMVEIFERIRELVAAATQAGDTGELSLLEYWMPIVILAGAVYIGRKRMISATQRLSEKMADNLTRLAPAASNWGGGGGAAVDFLSADRTMGHAAGSAYRGVRNAGYAAAVAGAFPVVLAARSHNVRWRERRMARRALRNLEIMKQLDHQPHTRIVRTRGADGKMHVTEMEEVQTIRNERSSWIPGRRQFGHHGGDNDRYSRDVAGRRGYDIDPATGYHRDRPGSTPTPKGKPGNGPTPKTPPGGSKPKPKTKPGSTSKPKPTSRPKPRGGGGHRGGGRRGGGGGRRGGRGRR